MTSNNLKNDDLDVQAIATQLANGTIDMQTITEHMRNRPSEDIKSFIDDLSHVLENKRKSEVSDLYLEFLGKAQKLGFTDLNAFLLAAESQGLLKNTSGSSLRKSVKIRYRDPDNTENTWTGRGKQPRWLVAKIEAGAKLEDFLIPEENTEDVEEKTEAKSAKTKGTPKPKDTK